jgi:hypothetical protein
MTAAAVKADKSEKISANKVNLKILSALSFRAFKLFFLKIPYLLHRQRRPYFVPPPSPIKYYSKFGWLIQEKNSALEAAKTGFFKYNLKSNFWLLMSGFGGIIRANMNLEIRVIADSEEITGHNRQSQRQ